MTLGMALHLALLLCLGLAGHLEAMSITVASGLILLLSSLSIFKHADLSRFIKFFS
jgi:hypothetical protein